MIDDTYSLPIILLLCYCSLVALASSCFVASMSECVAELSRSYHHLTPRLLTLTHPNPESLAMMSTRTF